MEDKTQRRKRKLTPEDLSLFLGKVDQLTKLTDSIVSTSTDHADLGIHLAQIMISETETAWDITKHNLVVIVDNLNKILSSTLTNNKIEEISSATKTNSNISVIYPPVLQKLPEDKREELLAAAREFNTLLFNFDCSIEELHTTQQKWKRISYPYSVKLIKEVFKIIK